MHRGNKGNWKGKFRSKVGRLNDLESSTTPISIGSYMRKALGGFLGNTKSFGGSPEGK